MANSSDASNASNAANAASGTDGAPDRSEFGEPPCGNHPVDASSLPRARSGSRVLRVLGPLLAPLARVYSSAVLRRAHRLAGHGERVEAPVLSVGNLTCGGTGKTPTVELVVRELLARGVSPAILSRGYRADASGANDEARVLAARLPGVPHHVGVDRVRSARRAIDAGAEVLVLDDGFQHWRLARDLDWVLLDALRPFDNGRTLPAGLLREPPEALGRAQLLGLTRVDLLEPERLETLRRFLDARFPDLPRVELVTRASGWIDLLDGTNTEAPATPVLAFAGIGHPEAFRLGLERAQLEVPVFLPFADHHGYTSADVERLAARARAAGLNTLVLTHKDAVKLREEPLLSRLRSLSRDAGLSWRVLEIRQEVVRGGEALARALDSLVARAVSARRGGASSSREPPNSGGESGDGRDAAR